jgi:hypothetical protein
MNSVAECHSRMAACNDVKGHFELKFSFDQIFLYIEVRSIITWIRDLFSLLTPHSGTRNMDIGHTSFLPRVKITFKITKVNSHRLI